MNEILAKNSISFNEKAVLTPTSYAKYSPKLREYCVRDEKILGFFIRIQPSGAKSYYVHARKGGVGKKVQRSLGKCEEVDFSQVKKEAKDWLFNIKQKGIDKFSSVIKEAKEERTLMNLSKQFLDLDKNLDEKTKADYLMVIKNRMPKFSKTRITEINKDDIVEWWSKSKGARSDVKAFIYARKIMEKCRASDYISENPFVDAKIIIGDFPSLGKTTNHIPKDKLNDFLSAFIKVSKDIPNVVRDYWTFLLITGKRRTETLSLKWTDVDFEKGTITLETAKFDKVDVIPMTQLSFLLLKSREKNKDPENSDWVFNSTTGRGHLSETHHHFKKLNKEIDMGFNLSAHDIRRTASTVTKELGLKKEDTSLLLNHAKQDVTDQYVFASQDYKRENLESVARFINQHSAEQLNWIAVNWYGGNSEMYTPSPEDHQPVESFEDKMKYLQEEYAEGFDGLGHPEFKEPIK